MSPLKEPAAMWAVSRQLPLLQLLPLRLLQLQKL
jgi:hypothetical protein